VKRRMAATLMRFSMGFNEGVLGVADRYRGQRYKPVLRNSA